jgi:DDE family transposase
MPTRINTQRRQALDRWTALLCRRLPSFSLPQAKVLALWSFGIVLARSCSLHAVVLALACWLPFNPWSLRKRLQEWYLEAAAKKGHGTAGTGYQRRDWQPHETAPELLAWLLDEWPHRQLVLALDPTNFGDRFTVLNISVLYRGCAVPVCWTVLEGAQPEAWEPHWERMLRTLAAYIPAGWQILVLTDRGMYSPRLFRCLRQLHWHPFLRIRAQGCYRPLGSREWLNLQDLQPAVGQAIAFPAEVFKNAEGRLECTLLAFQGAGYAEPWLLVSDLSAAVAQASWYGLRGWIEQGYKRVKGEGWNLPRTRITRCQRLERLWLAVALATLWVLQVGGAAEVEERSAGEPAPEEAAGSTTPALPDLEAAGAEPAQQKPAVESPEPGRPWSVFARGWQVLRNALAVGVLVLGSWHPEAWPNHPVGGLPPTPKAGAACAESQGPRPAALRSSIGVIHKCDSS